MGPEKNTVPAACPAPAGFRPAEQHGLAAGNDLGRGCFAFLLHGQAPSQSVCRAERYLFGASTTLPFRWSR